MRDDRLDEIVREILAEYERIGLRVADSPYGALAGDIDAIAPFLQRLRTMQPGVTWRDIFPNMPADWVPGRPETWRRPYKPFGAFDYPAPPAGPAFYVLWPQGTAAAHHDALVQRARRAGWPIYGGGVAASGYPSGGRDDLGFVILELGTSEEVVFEMVEWILRQPGVEHSRLYRALDGNWG